MLLLSLPALLLSAAAPTSAAEGPCDILAAAGNPCVAAHSTVRALYKSYSGSLYRVSRMSSNCSGGEFMKGYDWQGDNDQSQVSVKSIDECCAACADDSGCNHFSLTYSSMQCYLKTGDRVLVPNNGSTAGYCAKSPAESADISVTAPGGFADIAAHEKFCSAGDCVISHVFDQSPHHNHLSQRISTVSGKRVVHKMVNASRHKIGVRDGAAEVYGMWFDPGFGYNVDFTRGVARGNEPESLFAVMSGTHYNGECCFDYGNSENTITANGDYNSGAMEAIYFGNAHWKGNTGSGSGPWVGADLEAGMYFGGGNATIVNNASKPLTSDFVSLHLKGKTDGFMLKGGDATKGKLETMWDGPRPDPKLACCVSKTATYQPMRKKGAIILGTGGDNSNSAMGNFYEGVIATGVSSAATDDAIQKNIIAVGYKALLP